MVERVVAVSLLLILATHEPAHIPLGRGEVSSFGFMPALSCDGGRTPLSFRIVVGFCAGVELWWWSFILRRSMGCKDQATSPRWWRASILGGHRPTSLNGGEGPRWWWWHNEGAGGNEDAGGGN